MHHDALDTKFVEPFDRSLRLLADLIGHPDYAHGPLFSSDEDDCFPVGLQLRNRLTASAERRHDRGRNRLYAVEVRDGTGALVAEFRGRVYKVG